MCLRLEVFVVDLHKIVKIFFKLLFLSETKRKSDSENFICPSGAVKRAGVGGGGGQQAEGREDKRTEKKKNKQRRKRTRTRTVLEREKTVVLVVLEVEYLKYF